MRISIAAVVLFAFVRHSFAQDELMDILNAGSENERQYVTSTFKSTRLINGHSVETRTQGVLEFVISHRFGAINTGSEFFWGLDGAQIRLGLEYGITDALNVGVGRSSFQQVYDFFAKYRFIRQSNRMPFTGTFFTSLARRTDAGFDDVVGSGYESAFRNAYTFQMLLARKMDSRLSLQIMPSLIHRNYVSERTEPNDLFALGLGGRYKITNRITLNAEYYPVLNQDNDDFQDSFAIGVDIETGGHVFQLHLTNAQQINERGFIGENQGDFFDGDIHFGFNISRVFNVAVKK